MSTLNNKIYHYQNGDQECIRIGGTGANGVQICTGTFEFAGAATTKLNGKTSIYTGNKTNFVTFAKSFGSTPIILVAAKGSNYWFGGAQASTDKILNIDFYTNTNLSSLTVKGEYIAIGTAGTNITGMTHYSGYPMWKEGTKCVRIPYQNSNGTYTGIQICTGSHNTSGKVTINENVNSLSNILTLRTEVINGTFDYAYDATPKVFAAPSLPCRVWGDSTKFEHSYWFGTVSANASGVIKQRVFSNAARNHSIYGRYIAIGTYTMTASEASTWTQAPAYLENSGNNSYSLRFGTSNGMQFCYGTTDFSDRNVTKNLNELSTANVYTGFKRRVCMFHKSFTESPSTIIAPNKACGSSSHPFWFGDAASDAVNIINMDMYTNSKLYAGADAHIYVQYLALGLYNTVADKSSLAVREAFPYLEMNSISVDSNTDMSLQQYFLQRFADLGGDSQSNDAGWCSEFAAVMEREVGFSTFPLAKSVKGFIRELQKMDNPNSTTKKSRFYMASSDNSSFVPARLATANDSTSQKRSFGGGGYEFECVSLGGTAITTPQVGDLIFFNNNNSPCHTGLVINVNGTHIYTIEGNEDNINGVNGVAWMRYTLASEDLVGIGRVDWGSLPFKPTE